MIRLLKHVKEQHDHGIVHLDIKMDNICIDAAWGVRLLDYGQSRPTNDETLATCGRLDEACVPVRDPQPPHKMPYTLEKDYFSFGTSRHNDRHLPHSLTHFVLTIQAQWASASHRWTRQLLRKPTCGVLAQ